MSNPTTTVPTPVRKDRRGGIKSVIGDFVSAERLAVATNLQWVADDCDFPKAAPGLCYAAIPVTGNKTFSGIAVGDGPVFALYAGVQCYLGNDTDYAERARAQLEAGEARGVEEVLWEYGMSAGGTGPAQTSWVAAFGQADEAADTLYVGRPVIMVSRFVAAQARAAKAIFGDEEGNLWTVNGTPIIASAAASDTALIVFGWITVYASGLTTSTAYDPTVNQELALAERAYGIAVDCNFALHYDVTVTDGGGGGGVVSGPLGTLTGPVFVDPQDGQPQYLTLVTKESQDYVDYQWKTPTDADFLPRFSAQKITATKFHIDVSRDETRTYRAVSGPIGSELYSNEHTVEVALGLILDYSGEVVGQPIYPSTNPTYGLISELSQYHSINGGPAILQVASQNGPSSWGVAIDTTGLVSGDRVKIWSSSPGFEDSNVVEVILHTLVDDGWTVGELRQFAADHEPPIAIPSGAHKAEILALILAAIAEED